MAASAAGQLGEHNIWGKHTNFELGTSNMAVQLVESIHWYNVPVILNRRTGAGVPLIIRAPGQTVRLFTNEIVESVDLYPTLAALAMLPPPHDVDGISLAPLWRNPSPTKPIKGVAFSEYP